MYNNTTDTTKLGINLEEMRNFEFKRVDLTNPESILNYGSDVIEIMNSIVSSLARIMHDEDTSKVNFDEDIANINAFDNELEKLQTKDDKSQNNNFLEQVATQVVTKIFSKLPISLALKDNQEQKIDSYADLYTKYCDNIDNLCNKIIEDQTNVKNTMNTSNELLKALEGLLELLDNVIITGENDKNECLTKLDELEKDPANEMKVQSIKGFIRVFDRKLSDLKEVLATNKIHYFNLLEKNVPNMEILMQYEKFVKTTSTSLKLQTHDIIGTKQQSDRLNHIQQLSKTVNESMIKNSETLNENIAKAQQLGSTGFIDVKTLTTLKDNASKAIKSLQDYRTIIDKKRQENDKIVGGILNDLNQLGSKQANILPMANFDEKNLLTVADIDDLSTLETESFSDNEENGKSLKKELGTINNVQNK